MGKHILQLFFPDCSNEGVFLIDDISIYDGLAAGISGSTVPGLPVACANLQITPPGFKTPTSLSVIPQSRLILNACTMGTLSASACANSCPDLEDGMYNIRYSVSPNDLVYVEYKILRIVRAMNRLNRMLCRIGLTPCLPSADVESELRNIDTIRDYLISAKMTVENEHQYADGINQYVFAVGLMDKMSYRRQNC
jgi:hypothetical protein